MHDGPRARGRSNRQVDGGGEQRCENIRVFIGVLLVWECIVLRTIWRYMSNGHTLSVG